MIGSVYMWSTIVAVMLQVSAANAPGQEPKPEEVSPSTTPLKVIDEAGTAHTTKAEDFVRLPRKSVKVTTRGVEAEFTGTSLVDLLKSHGVAFGSDLRGKRTPTVAILEATDEYRVVLSLLEIDPDTTDKMAIVADQPDGKPLGSDLGPYRLVIPGDKRKVRWIRNLRMIRIVNLRDFPLESRAPTGATQQN